MTFDLQQMTVMGRQIARVEPNRVDALADWFCAAGGRQALFCNVHMLMLSQNDEDLASAMDRSTVVLADGAPISWLQRRLTRKRAACITGIQFTLMVCERAAIDGRAVGFFGTTSSTLSGVADRLKRDFPQLDVRYLHAPEYSPGQLRTPRATLDAINQSGVDFLFIGLGCPKQEIWIRDHRDRLNCSLLGVGAAFDWLAGTVNPPPRWMFSSGLAWLYRLIQNPLRMAPRYLKYNTMFLFRVAQILVRRKGSP